MNTVSETALLTLRSRVVEAGKKDPVLKDPVGKICFERLLDTVPQDLRIRILERKLSPVLTRHLALRARKYDALCMEFLKEYPDGLIVNLGCGFDTRFWRMGIDELKFIELDLKEVINLKSEILGDRISYTLIGDSVLEEEWIDEVKLIQSSHVLFLAEGLFMYFQPDQSIRVLKRIADSFNDSRLVMEVVHEKYTRGSYKKMVERKMKRRAGSAAGEYFLYGIKHGSDLESYHPGFRLRAEWSFFEDVDIRPSFLKIFRNIRTIAKSQYTVVADIH